MITLAIDPGLHDCGCAVFSESELVEAWLARSFATMRENGPGTWVGMADAVVRGVRSAEIIQIDLVVVELPQVYRVGLSKGDPNDLIQLAAVVGAITSRFQSVRAVHPREWKGAVPKKVVESETKKALGASVSRVRLPQAGSLSHNVWDAVALGLWATRGTWRP